MGLGVGLGYGGDDGGGGGDMGGCVLLMMMNGFGVVDREDHSQTAPQTV